ncbi:MAG: hypothetical protein QOG36_1871 [Actinomycetota bacterium]|nr:hypothetical protein [Actinomycetota bacterium]
MHESPDCVADLVANLRWCDPDSLVLLYDGAQGAPQGAGQNTGGAPQGAGQNTRREGPLRDRHWGDAGGVLVHPWPRPVGWGRLHEFAIDCLRLAVECLDFASITFVDSDQLAVREGYSRQLGVHLGRAPGAGCLVSVPGVQPPTTLFGPAQAAWHEIELWRPFLRRFPGGEDKFPHWTFWPGTVFTRAAATGILELYDDEELQGILGRSSLWATEEVLLASLAALAGHDVVANPFSHPALRYRTEFSADEIDEALRDPACWWVHPVARSYDDPIRRRVREACQGYRPLPGTAATVRCTGTTPSPPRPHPPAHLTPVRRSVSCVLAAGGGPAVVAMAIRRFLAGEPEDRELIIVDDGANPVRDLVPADPRIRYLRLAEPHSPGEQRNVGCAQAWGEVIEHWDGAGVTLRHRRRDWELQPFTP